MLIIDSLTTIHTSILDIGFYDITTSQINIWHAKWNIDLTYISI